MSYSDYGAYVWLNGERCYQREDCSMGDRYYHAMLGTPEKLVIFGHKFYAVVVSDEGRIVFPRDYKEKKMVLRGDNWIIERVSYPHSEGVLMALKDNSDLWTGVVGYGIGSHWWKTDDGYEFQYPGDREIWLDGEDWYKELGDDALLCACGRAHMHQWSSTLYLEDCKKYGLDPETSKRTVLGYKPLVPWPTYEMWKEKVSNWASEVMKKSV